MIIENLKQPSFNQNPPISFRDYKNLNEEAFKTELRELDWSFVTENNDINLGFETFLRFINKTLDKHAPIKTVKKRKKNNIQAVVDTTTTSATTKEIFSVINMYKVGR